jgi:hypothetical protein
VLIELVLLVESYVETRVNSRQELYYPNFIFQLISFLKTKFVCIRLCWVEDSVGVRVCLRYRAKGAREICYRFGAGEIMR